MEQYFAELLHTMCCDAMLGAGDNKMTMLQFRPQRTHSLSRRQATTWIIIIWYDEDDKGLTGT